MREIRPSGSEGGAGQSNAPLLPLSGNQEKPPAYAFLNSETRPEIHQVGRRQHSEAQSGGGPVEDKDRGDDQEPDGVLVRSRLAQDMGERPDRPEQVEEDGLVALIPPPRTAR